MNETITNYKDELERGPKIVNNNPLGSLHINSARKHDALNTKQLGIKIRGSTLSTNF